MGTPPKPDGRYCSGGIATPGTAHGGSRPMIPPAAVIPRHKTAIRRPGFSLPVKSLLRDGLLPPQQTFFDYGCGRGQDLHLLRDLGIPCDGWDPVHRSAAAPTPA